MMINWVLFFFLFLFSFSFLFLFLLRDYTAKFLSVY